MNVGQSLIAELEEAIESGSKDSRHLRAIGVLQFENLSLGCREPTPGFSCAVGRLGGENYQL